MSFEIGQRVTSRWAGPGTISGELEKEQESEVDASGRTKISVTCFQKVLFDNPSVGERRWEIRKLNPLGEDVSIVTG
jgi:hypothetical protein